MNTIKIVVLAAAVSLVATTGKAGTSMPATVAKSNSRTISLLALGALPNDPATDTAAMNQAIADAKAAPGSTIYMDLPLIALTSPGSGGFAIPSDTIVKGLGRDATEVSWNDNDGTAADAVNNNLFAADLTTGAAGNASNTAFSITFKDFHVVGTLATYNTVQAGSGGYPFIPYGVNHLRFDHVGSRYSRLMAFSPRQSNDVVFDDIDVNYSGRDGVNCSSCSQEEMIGGTVDHTDDDGIAFHSATGDANPTGGTGGARRDVVIVGVRMFDTEGIHVLSARSTSITGNILFFSRYHGIDVNTVTATGSNGPEGLSGQFAIDIGNNVITDVWNRAAIGGMTGGDPAGGLVQGNDYVQVDCESSRAGTYGNIPGSPAFPGNPAGETAGTIHSPYPEENANSNATTVPTAKCIGVSVHNNKLQRTLPPTDGTDSRFTAIAALQIGNTFTRNSYPAGLNPSISDANMRGDGFHLYGGDMEDVDFTDNTVVGMATGVEAGSGGSSYGHLMIRGNHFRDMTYAGVLIDNDTTSETISGTATTITTKGIVDIEDNDFDLDPYQKASGRSATGTWTSQNGPTGILNNQSSKSSYLSYRIVNNRFRNVVQDIGNIDAGSLIGTTYYTGVGADVHDNTDYLTPVNPNYFSSSNGGIGFFHLVGFRFVDIDTNPKDAAYDTVTFAPPVATYAEPATGGPWVVGTWVANALTVSSPTAPRGWLRLTTGTGNVDGTDWSARQ